MQDLERRESASQSSALLADVFGAFREARKTDAQAAFLALQDKVAENAGELVRLNLSSMKEIVDTLLKLDAARKEDPDDEKANEKALQLFLRKPDGEEGTVQ